MIYGYLSVMIKHDSIHSLRVAVPPPPKEKRKEGTFTSGFSFGGGVSRRLPNPLLL